MSPNRRKSGFNFFQNLGHNNWNVLHVIGGKTPKTTFRPFKKTQFFEKKFSDLDKKLPKK